MTGLHVQEMRVQSPQAGRTRDRRVTPESAGSLRSSSIAGVRPLKSVPACSSCLSAVEQGGTPHRRARKVTRGGRDARQARVRREQPRVPATHVESARLHDMHVSDATRPTPCSLRAVRACCKDRSAARWTATGSNPVCAGMTGMRSCLHTTMRLRLRRHATAGRTPFATHADPPNSLQA